MFEDGQENLEQDDNFKQALQPGYQTSINPPKLLVEQFPRPFSLQSSALVGSSSGATIAANKRGVAYLVMFAQISRCIGGGD